MGVELINRTNKASHFQKEYLPLDHYDSILSQKSFMVNTLIFLIIKK